MACKPGGRIVDRRRQRPYGDIDQLAKPEGRILYEGSFTAQQQEPGHVIGVEVGAVHDRKRGAMGQIFAYPDRQFEPTVVPAAQLHQPVEVGGGDHPGRTWIDERERGGAGRGRFGVDIGRKGRKVDIDGQATLGGDGLQQILHPHEPDDPVQVGDKAEHGRQGQ